MWVLCLKGPTVVLKENVVLGAEEKCVTLKQCGVVSVLS